MTTQEVMAHAKDLIERDDVAVYDACANIGQIVDNLPHRVLVRVVADFLMEEGG